MTDQPATLSPELVEPLGDVERGILLAAEREAHPVSWWCPGGAVADRDRRVVSLETLYAILARSSALRGERYKR